MIKIRKQRAIVDRIALTDRLEAVVAEGLVKHKRRQAVLALFKQALSDGHAIVQSRFEASNQGTEAVHENCFLVDQLVRIIHDHAVAHEFDQRSRTTGEILSIVAVGGYGRGELSPHSDIDLLFVLPYKTTPYAEQVVEYILYMLWDMGLKVGHATRSVEECMRQAKADLTIRTALLEMRWLWGDKALFAELKKRYRAEICAGTGEEFVDAKLAERDTRHETMGDSRYVLEPNIKEGKGGLRDLHTLYWMAKYLYDVSDVAELVGMGILTQDAVSRFAKAQAFLWTVRCHLHYLTGRCEDRLTFDVQQEIGRRMNYTDHAGTRGVERFMKHYFLIAKDVGDLTRIFCAVLEDQNKRKPRGVRLAEKFLFLKRSNIDGFKLDGGRLNVMADDDFAQDPLKLISLFHTALKHDLDIHPNALSLVTRNLRRVTRLRNNEQANRLFVEMLTSPTDPESALRHMSEAGVLARFIPDFGRVVAQMQYDMYHVYTVDEHTLLAIGILHRIEAGALRDEAPVASQVIHKVLSRRALYLATFLHDIAKGRGGDHSELGAEVAQKLGPRLGLTDEETETASWLVRHHLLMTRTAFKRDIDDPKTIQDFISVVQSPERLRLLLALTVADIRAVGPGVWNGWKAGLLRELYYRAEEVMSGGFAVEKREARVEAAQSAFRQALSDWPEKDVEAQIARGYPSYWVSFDTASHLRHARLIRDAEARHAPLTIESRVDNSHSVTEMTIYASDHPGLFSQIAGAMAVSGASIVDAKVITLANGMALDTLWIQDSDGRTAFNNSSKLAKLTATIEKALTGRLRASEEIEAKKSPLQSRTEVFKVAPRVLIDNKASSTHTLIELNGRDRPGLLHDVTSAMTRCGIQIASAHISTYGERVVDVFYVKDIFGLKITHTGKLKQIREALTGALAPPDEDSADRGDAGRGDADRGDADRGDSGGAGKDAAE